MNTYNNNYRSGNSKLTAMNGMLGAALFMLCFSCFVSCSDDLTNADAEAMSYDLTRGYTDEQVKVQRLGFSYDAAGNVMDDSSFSAKPIINMDRLQAAEKDLGPIISSERRHYTSMDIFSGNTLQELGHAETKYTIDDSEVIGSGKYYRNNTTLSHTTWHNSYKAHMFIKHIMVTKTIDVGTLHCLKLDDLNDNGSVLEADFRKAVAELVKKGENNVTEADATTFSKKFGTHLVVSSNLGGIQMDALFVDEGFGTLDRKSIESAMDILVNLSGANKLVGIISHREELMENIPQQIRVNKTKNGSMIEIDTGA